MDKLDLQTIRSLQQAGQLTKAKKGYLKLLRKNPRDVEALHGLGILYAQQKNYPEAIKNLQSALKLEPKSLLVNLHLANILKFQGLFHQAAEILENLLIIEPNYAAALNNLGTVYYSLEKFPEAINQYRKALLNQPDYVDAYYNLGLALVKQKEFSAACDAYKQLLVYAPEHFAARFHLACTLALQENFSAAIEVFLQIEASHPNHFETETNLATCYLKLGALNEAKLHYFKALALFPKDPQVLFNLGVINMQQGQVDTAIQYYQRAALVNPDDFAVQNNLGVAFLAKQHLGLALQHFREALRIKPNDVSINHTIKILSENQHLLASPPDYVKSLFDSYADHYEPHLLNTLEYKVPDLLYAAVANSIKLNSRSLSILDLGCGTGLCGALFKPFAKSLIGVDLSAKMLSVAKDKAIYDELIESDITTFLENKKLTYDLILAGDVLVYIGKLDELIKNISDALVTKGLFVFNAEIDDEVEFKMNQSGRFSHSRKYLEKLAKENLFEIAYYQVQITRMQNNEPVYGHVFVFIKNG